MIERRNTGMVHERCNCRTHYLSIFTVMLVYQFQNRWICTYMLVGTAKGCQSVGQAGNDYNGLVTEVIVELMNAIEQRESVIFPEGTIPRLAAYTDVVTDFPCAVKEFQWRNQYFFQLQRSDDVNAAACPIHNELLQECETKGYLSFDLPK